MGDHHSIATTVQLVRALYAAGDVAAAREASVPLECMALTEERWITLFRLFRTVRDNTRAELVTGRFLAIEPDNEVARLEYINLLTEIKRLQEAKVAIASFLASPNRSAHSLFMIGSFQLRLRMFVEATDTARRGIALNRSSFDLRMLLAEALYRRGDLGSVVRELRGLAQLAGEEAHRWACVAEVASWVKRRRMATYAIGKVLALPIASDGIYLRIARAQTSLRLYADALEMLTHISVHTATDPSFIRKILAINQSIVDVQGPTLTSCQTALYCARRLALITNSPDLYRELIDEMEGQLSTPWPTPAPTVAGPLKRVANRLLKRIGGLGHS